ncbi:MAG: endonuclease/exonuclease/phosphatase family protein [Candidatus Acidiferrales bacterium]
MPSRPEWVERIRNLIASLAVVGAVGTGAFLTAPAPDSDDVLRVGAFNIQVFGQTKLAKQAVVDVLVETAQQFDLLAVEEVRDSTEMVADEFLARLNEQAESEYVMFEGERLGRSSSKEQYVLYYLPSRLQLVRAFTLPDPNDVFEREPLVATFRAGNFDFTLLVCHIKPEAADAELVALRDAALSVLEADPDEADIIFLGDFNADGSYLDESHRLFQILPTNQFDVAIANDMVTTTISQNTYDRIVLLPATSGHEYILGSAQPFRFDTSFGLTDPALIRAVSDHYPVFARFRTDLEDDD